MSTALSTASSNQVNQNDYSSPHRDSFKFHVRKSAFIVLLILGALLLPVVGMYAKVHIETKQAFAQTRSDVEKAQSFNLPNVSQYQEKLNQGEQAISIITSFNQLYTLQTEARTISQEVTEATLTYQRTQFEKSIDLFKTTLSNTEIISIPSYKIMKNVYLDFSGKQSGGMKLDDLKTQISTLQFYQTQLENELDKAKVSLLYSGLQDSKQEAVSIEKFLSIRGNYPEENKKIAEYLAKIDSVLAAKQSVTLTSSELENKIQNEIYSILELPKATKKNIEEQEINKLKEISAQENARRASRGLSSAPSVPLNSDGAIEEKVIYINIARQEIFLYERGQLINSSFTVTGKPGFETVTGSYRIYSKQRNAILRSPFEGIEYEVPVSYWMPFYSGYGLHDANWREKPGRGFGGGIYKWDGSHGCANLPTSMAAYIWNWAPVGTMIHVD